MPSFFDHWFGVQSAARRVLTDTTFEISDGELTVDFTDTEFGWSVLVDGWQPKVAGFKSGGFYADSQMADGQRLRHTAFDDVVESFQAKLQFYTADGMSDSIGTLLELLEVRAPRYWTDTRYHKPVWMKLAMPGETNATYALLSQGGILLPQSSWNRTETVNNGTIQPILVTVIRAPFLLSAQPGTVQGNVELLGQENWDYNLAWAEEDTLPAGYIFCFVETTTGDIYAGGESEILKWNGTAWAAVATAPVTLTANVTAAIELANGDLIFGESGRTVKLSSGTWSVEDSTPSGQVYGLILADDGVIYAADNGQIVKRTAAGVWSVDDTLPSGQVYSFVQSSASGRVFAGGTKEILGTLKEEALTATTLLVQIAAATDEAEQYGTTTYTDPTVESDLDLLNRNYVGMRFQLNIPVGATINSAKLKWLQYKNESGSAYAGKIYCEAADDSAAFAATTNNVSGRSLTTAYTTWQDTTIRRKGHWWNSLDVSAPLQEVIDRGGWVANQHVSVIVKCDTLASGIVVGGQRDVYAYCRDPNKAPIFEITYTPAPSANQGWVVVSTTPAGNVRSMLEVDNLLLAGETGQILGSDDDGDTWGVIDTTPTDECRALYQDSDGRVWGGDNGNILLSNDGGRNWATDSTTPTGYVEAIIEETSTMDLRSGDNGRILIRDSSDTVTLGRDETTYDEVFVANHDKVCNLTHIKIDDGGVFSDLWPMTGYPVTLLPAVPAVNDAIYFGIDTSESDTGPFFGLVFDIETPASATTSYTITWEYYKTAEWTTLTTHDETVDLSQVGVRYVSWCQPSDWATVAVDGTTGYWVRARVSALTGTLTPPTQANRSIYTPSWSYAEMQNNQAKGNVPSLVKIKVHQRADEGGPGGSAPLLYSNRVVCGVKRYTDHEKFQAFINFSDDQNIAGITIDTSVDTDSATSIEADSNLSSATGRRVFFDAGVAEGVGGLNNWVDRVEIELDTTIARDWYGTYKAFLRGKQNGGSAGEVSLRIKVVSGTGGISSIGDTQVTEATTDHNIIEFDTPVVIPVSSQMTPDDIGDTTSIIVQIATAANDADMYLYGLVLVPVDVAWWDACDKANTAESSVENGRRLLVDSITVPKSPTRALVQKLATDSFVASWRLDSDGPARLPAQEKLRLWFLTMRTTAAASTVWLSEPEMCHSVTVEYVDRWLFGRGAA